MKGLVFASLLVVAALGLARADSERPGRDWIPISTVTAKLYDMGFTDISSIEADDGLWKAKAYKNGEYYKVKLDPYTGRMVDQNRKHHHHADGRDAGHHDED